MNNLILILLIIVIVFHIISFIKSYDVAIELQPGGWYLIWYTGEHNAFGEYYKLTHRTCIWRTFQKK